jgi:hypothetical protein
MKRGGELKCHRLLSAGEYLGTMGKLVPQPEIE